MKRILVISLLLMIILFSCKTQSPATNNNNPQVNTPPTCPNCDDSNSCTEDVCGENTNYECRNLQMVPCCGNGICEHGENCASDCQSKNNPEVEALLAKSKIIKYYSYTLDVGSQELAIFVRDQDIKIKFDKLYNTGQAGILSNFAYDTYYSFGNGTAYITCERNCNPMKARAAVPNYISTPRLPLAQMQRLLSANVVGIENLQNYPSVVLEQTLADGTIERVKVSQFYGMPLIEEVWNAKKTEILNKTNYKAMEINSQKINLKEFSLPYDPVLGSILPS